MGVGDLLTGGEILSAVCINNDHMRDYTIRAFGFVWFDKVWNKKLHALRTTDRKVGNECGNIPDIGSCEVTETIPAD